MDSLILLFECFRGPCPDLFGESVLANSAHLNDRKHSFSLFHLVGAYGECARAHHIKTSRAEVTRIQRSSLDESSHCQLRGVWADLCVFKFLGFEHTDRQRSYMDRAAVPRNCSTVFSGSNDWVVHQCKTSPIDEA